MSSFLFNVTGIFVVWPFVLVFFMYLILKKVSTRKKALILAIDISTIFFVLSVFIHVNVLFPKVSFYYLFYLLIGIGIFVTYFHWKKYQDLLFSRLLRQYWRLTFFIFFLFYISMGCYGLFHRIMEYIA